MSNKVWDKISYAQSEDASRRLYEKRVEQCIYYMLEQDTKSEQLKAAEAYNRNNIQAQFSDEAT